MNKRRIIYAIAFCLLLVTEVLIALYVHDSFIRPYIGDVLVTVLLCCLCRVFIPKGIKALPGYVLLFAAAVEISQYFDLVKLIGLENSQFFSTLMGRTFSFEDILCYAVGCLVFFLADLFFGTAHKPLTLHCAFCIFPISISITITISISITISITIPIPIPITITISSYDNVFSVRVAFDRLCARSRVGLIAQKTVAAEGFFVLRSGSVSSSAY